jgi:23S rRNA pseudouridine2605 synthase
MIEGRRTAPAEVKVLPHGRDAREATLSIVIREGRNRQVRKMCEGIGHPVTHLKRVAIGPIRDSRLKPGQWRELSEDELKRLRRVAASERPIGRDGKFRSRP